MTPTLTQADYANRLAEQLHTALRDIEMTYRTAWETWRVADAFIPAVAMHALSDDAPAVPKHVTYSLKKLRPEIRRELLFAAQDGGVRRLWQQTRMVYKIDGDAWASIGDADPKSLVPLTVAQRLPHPNPLLVFPEPLLLEHGEKERQRVVGVFVSGVHANRSGDASLCSTHAPNVAGWTLTFAGLVEDYNGKPVMYSATGQDVMWSRSTLILKEGDTLQDLMVRAVARFNGMTDPDLVMGDPSQDVPKMLARAVNMLVYLSATNADLRPLPARPAPKRAKTRGPAPLKPVKVVAVGFNIGSQLRAWRRRASEAARGAGTGRTVKPHIRRSHPHTIRYGPGRQYSKLIWMWPIEVNMKFGAQQNTVIPAKDPRKIRRT